MDDCPNCNAKHTDFPVLFTKSEWGCMQYCGNKEICNNRSIFIRYYKIVDIALEKNVPEYISQGCPVIRPNSGHREVFIDDNDDFVILLTLFIKSNIEEWVEIFKEYSFKNIENLYMDNSTSFVKVIPRSLTKRVKMKEFWVNLITSWLEKCVSGQN